MTRFLLAFLALAAAFVEAAQPTITHRTIDGGEYYEYLPNRAPTGMLVLAHGSVDEEQSKQGDVTKIAQDFARRWTAFADEHGLIVVAPVFGKSFGSWISEPGVALGGYRGLEGKTIGADEFVDRIVERYRAQLGGENRFYLYGHSAGGQFAGRYAIRHPERIKALVLSAPGRYAFPDPTAPWPYGQKEVAVRAMPDATPRVIRPDPGNWIKVAALPITVVVGSADTQPQPPRKDHSGSTRIDYARHWVAAMTPLAPAGNARIHLVVVPRIGHSSAGLTPECQKALEEMLRK